MSRPNSNDRPAGSLRIAAGMLAAVCALGAAAAVPSPPAVERAEALLYDGRLVEAAAEFERLLAADPASERALLGRIDALLALDDWRRALEEAERRRAAAPASAAAVTGLAEALVRAGRLAEAEAALEPLVGRREPPGRLSGRALSLLGMLRAASGRAAEAIELMDRAVEAAPDDRRVLVRAAEATASRAEAVRRLQRYLELALGDDADRIEGAQGTLRVLRQLGEREVWIPASRPEQASWPLEWLVENGERVGAIVRVRLGEKRKRARLLLDTGSSGLFLDERLAERVGFEALAAETTFGGGGDQRHDSRRGVISLLAMDDLEFRDVLVTAARNAFPAVAPYRGVLGISMLAGYRVTVDLARGRLEIDREGPLVEGDRYWTLAGQMLVPAAEASGVEGLFLFDTGASRSVVDEGFVERCPEATLSAPARVAGFGGEVRGARLVDGVQLAFQGATGAGPLRAVDLSLRSRLGGVELAGYLGMDLLAGRAFTIDTRSRRVLVRDDDR